MCNNRSGFRSRKRREVIALWGDGWRSNFSFSTSEERLLSVRQSGVSARVATLYGFVRWVPEMVQRRCWKEKAQEGAGCWL